MTITEAFTNGGEGIEARDRQPRRGPTRHGSLHSGLDHRENDPGVMKHHINGDVQVIFTGEAYARYLGYLIGQYTAFASREIGWSQAYARRMAIRGLGIDGIVGTSRLNSDKIGLLLQNPDVARRMPSAMLIREESAKPGNYLAMAAHRMYFPVISLAGQPDREEPVLYGVLRAIAVNERGKNRGRAMVESALMLHSTAKWFAHRTGYDLAAYVNTQSEALDQERAYPWLPREPWARPFTENPLAWAVEQEMSKLLGNPVPVDEWGICRELYAEPNKNVDIVNEPTHPGRARVWKFMYKTHEMTTRDGILPLYRRR